MGGSGEAFCYVEEVIIMKEYSKEFINKINKLKEDVIKLANKVNAGEDARTACGVLNRSLSNNWNDIDATIFAEEPSELERQTDAAIEQAYQIPI